MATLRLSTIVIALTISTAALAADPGNCPKGWHYDAKGDECISKNHRDYDGGHDFTEAEKAAKAEKTAKGAVPACLTGGLYTDTCPKHVSGK